ncbi:MAG TPA: hypothetical protein VLC52_03860 [Anaerolineae bacterium]|nr:hypothetical protein [Anaerolineae bacterium]
MNRLTFKDYPTGSDVYYEYDNSQGGGATLDSWGRLRSVHVGSTLEINERLYEYDNRGRTVKEESKIDGTTYTTLYAYDAADRVKAMTYPGSPAEPVTTVYNGQGLPETLTGSQAYVTEAAYNGLGQKKRYTLDNGAVTTWTYYGESPVEGQLH